MLQNALTKASENREEYLSVFEGPFGLNCLAGDHR